MADVTVVLMAIQLQVPGIMEVVGAVAQRPRSNVTEPCLCLRQSQVLAATGA